jgi:hypothetical protein
LVLQTLDEFLLKKRINRELLYANDPDGFRNLNDQFEVMGPKSFDQRYKFYLNDWRLRFPLSTGGEAQTDTKQ